MPPDDRSGWDQLQAQTLYLLAQALAARPEGPHNVQVWLFDSTAHNTTTTAITSPQHAPPLLPHRQPVATQVAEVAAGVAL